MSPELLYRRCDPAQFDFASTAELDNQPTDSPQLPIVGQARAIDAIRFGIGMQHKGYNLYVLGPNGTGKRTAVRHYLEQKAAAEPTPDDWCYVNNFDQPDRPRFIRLPAGRATTFQRDMDKLVEELSTVLPAAFSGEEYGLQKRAVEEEFRSQQSDALEQLRNEAKERNIALLQTPGGFAFAPLKNEKEVINPEEFMGLPPDEQKRIQDEVAELQEALQKIMRQMPQLQRTAQSRLRELNEQVAEFTVAALFQELRQQYDDLPKVLAYLEEVREDVVRHFEDFLQDDRPQANPLLGIASAPQRLQKTRYRVNVLVDHSESQGAPVIVDDQPRYQNLIGRVEHVSQMGALLTDFTLIKPGTLHLANGGYLILDARRLLAQAFSWDALKHALREGEIRIESLGQVYGAISTVSLEPEPIPLDVKIVLVGDRWLYYNLSAFDLEFSELFKVAADFEDVMPRGEENVHAYARLIASVVRRDGLKPFDPSGVARVVEHGSRMAADAEKLSAHMQSISDLLREADYWATEAGHELVSAADVQKALDTQRYHAGRVREQTQESILRETVLIDTSGEVVGQLNGLSVQFWGNYAFGRPSRITARIRMGKGDVADIERQVNLAGPTHSKGVLILSSFLANRYAGERPLSMSATLVFEQSYGPVEGDSASSAELYALLSALASAPIKQSLAVTGSVNQWGEVQAIGGVNEKIEGFFDLCKARGLTGEQGVIVPKANVKHLMLRQEVVDAAAAGQFHIYAVSTIDEGITLLTGIPAGEADQDGDYPEDTINGRVVARLIELDEKQRSFGGPPKNNNNAEKEDTDTVAGVEVPTAPEPDEPEGEGDGGPDDGGPEGGGPDGGIPNGDGPDGDGDGVPDEPVDIPAEDTPGASESPATEPPAVDAPDEEDNESEPSTAAAPVEEHEVTEAAEADKDETNETTE